MAMSKGRKIVVGLAIFLLAVIFILPYVLGMALRANVEKKIAEAVNAPVKLGGLAITVLTPGATLSDLEVGEASALTGGQPLAKIGTLRATVGWGTVFGGDLHVTGLTIKEAQVHVGADEQGASTLAQFLDKMPPTTRAAPLPVDSLALRNSRITLHVPKAVIAPKSALTPEPVTIEIGQLDVDSLVLPAPGAAVPKEAWTAVSVSGLSIRSPFKGETAAAAGEGTLPEGLDLQRIEGQLMFPDALTKPLKLQRVRIEGLRFCNVVRQGDDPETMERIQIARDACLKSPPPKPGEKGMSLGNGGIYLADFTIAKSAIEVQGPDASGKTAYWRIADLQGEIARIGVGPSTAGLAESPGLVKLSSPTKSSEGDGTILIEWNDVRGSFPQLSCTQKLEFKRIAVAPYNERILNASANQVGVEKGTVGLDLAGPVTDGNLDLKGHLAFSDDFKTASKGMGGKMASWLGMDPTGKKLPVHVRGTLLAPDPSVEGLSKAAMEMGKKVFTDKGGSLLGIVGDTASGAVNTGVQEGKKLLKKIPGVGGLFGGDKTTEEEQK